MTEKQPRTTEGATTTYADWPTLIERVMDDVSRILRSEVHILQAGIGVTLEGTSVQRGSAPDHSRSYY